MFGNFQRFKFLFMKKIILLFLVALFCFDSADAQMMFKPQQSHSYLPGLSSADDATEVLKKRKKRRKKGKRGKKGSDMTMAFGGGLFVGLPMGDFGDIAKTGFGLNVEAEYFVVPQFSVGVNTGFYNFGYDAAVGDGSSKIFPFLAKGSFYLSDGPFKPYLSMGLGIFGINSKYTFNIESIIQNPLDPMDFDTLTLKAEVKEKLSKFGMAPAAGFIYTMSDNLHLHFGLKYDVIFTAEKKDGIETKNTGFLGLNFGLLYSL